MTNQERIIALLGKLFWFKDEIADGENKKAFLQLLKKIEGLTLNI